MVRTEVEYQAVEESDGSPKKEDGGQNQLEEKEEEEKTTLTKKKKRRKREKEGDVIKEEDEEEDLNTDSNDADSNNNPSPTRRPNILRRTMSFLASLPRKLFTYVREVFYAPREHRWTHGKHYTVVVFLVIIMWDSTCVWFPAQTQRGNWSLCLPPILKI